MRIYRQACQFVDRQTSSHYLSLPKLLTPFLHEMPVAKYILACTLNILKSLISHTIFVLPHPKINIKLIYLKSPP